MNPEEAIEAAHGQFCTCDWPNDYDTCESMDMGCMRAALEAAAPYLIREARAAELEAAAAALAPSGTLWWGDRGVLVAEGDGALPTVTLNVWLTARAAVIRAGEA